MAKLTKNAVSRKTRLKLQ